MRPTLATILLLLALPVLRADEPELRATRTDLAPTIDGDGGDPAWARATALRAVGKRVMPPLDDVRVAIDVRALHTATHVYLLVGWDDPTENVTHKTWTWDDAKQAYVEGPDREDMFSVALEHTGPFDADMLDGKPAVWDVWHWKAGRTNPQGYAMDKTHRYTREKPEGKAVSHPATDGSPVWIARPEDAGDSVERKQPAPGAKSEPLVPQFLPGTPTGSAADVSAKGRWSHGRWTLELARRLDTGYADDTRLDLARHCRFALATFDHTGNMDKATRTLVLTFDPPPLDRAAIDERTGAKGAWFEAECVHKVTFPRADVPVTVDGETMPPFMGLTSWAAFRAGKTAEAMVMGDLVLFADEVDPVMSVALENGLAVTALHNHFSFDDPKVYFMHLGGEGATAALATAVRRCVDRVREIRGATPVPPRTFGAAPLAGTSAIPIEPIERAFGTRPAAKDGMVKVVLGRTTRVPCGCEVGKEMGVNTWAAFRGTTEVAIVDGDFACLAGELQPVLKALRAAEIHVVAIHNHMEAEEPRVLFLHYWGRGTLEQLCTALRSALDAQRAK